MVIRVPSELITDQREEAVMMASAPAAQLLRTPCQEAPDDWELPNFRLPQSERIARVAAVVAACRACPKLLACQEFAEEKPPDHACVLAGLVYDGGKPVPLAKWSELLAKRVTANCANCDEQFELRNQQMIYCSKECARAAFYSRAKGRRQAEPENTRILKPCGTHAAYVRHKRRGEPIDDACAAANRVKARNEKARARKIRRSVANAAATAPDVVPVTGEGRVLPATADVVALKPCGTPAAYLRHKENGEPIDEKCLQAVTKTKPIANCAHCGAPFERRLSWMIYCTAECSKQSRLVRRRGPDTVPAGTNLKPCGTRAAYARHRRRGETVDDACQTAYEVYKISKRNNYHAGRGRAELAAVAA